MMYGILIAELIYISWIRRVGEERRYDRAKLWLIGAIGGWSPDLDGASGIFVGEFLDYHRKYSHSLLFLFVEVVILIYLIYSQASRNTSGESKNEADKIDTWRKHMPGVSFALWVISSAIYSNETMLFAIFFILGSLIAIGLSFALIDRPLYGIIFFVGALFHHFCDALVGAWNPFGPWDPTGYWGFHLYGGGRTESLFSFTMFIILEFGPHFIVLGIAIIILVRWKRQKRLN